MIRIAAIPCPGEALWSGMTGFYGQRPMRRRARAFNGEIECPTPLSYVFNSTLRPYYGRCGKDTSGKGVPESNGRAMGFNVARLAIFQNKFVLRDQNGTQVPCGGDDDPVSRIRMKSSRQPRAGH